MNRSMRVRSLTGEELENKKFRASEVGRLVASLGQQVSIFGNADHLYIRYLHLDDSKLWKYEHLGGGDYLYDGPPPREAHGGRQVPILWGVSEALTYLRTAAEGLQIPIFFGGDVIYFESKYADAFLDAFAYVDGTFQRLNGSSSFISRFFGGGIPEWNSKESKGIQQEIRNILAKAMRSRH